MKVLSKQKNSKMCYICGMFNPMGLKCQFYNMEDDSVMTLFKFREEHQSFPQRVHGGLIGTMLDELAFRSYWVKDDTVFGVTMSMETKFRKPVPYEMELVGKGIIISDSTKFFKTKTMILDREGTLYAEAETNYIKLPVAKIAKDVSYHEEIGYFSDEYLEEI